MEQEEKKIQEAFNIVEKNLGRLNSSALDGLRLCINSELERRKVKQ